MGTLATVRPRIALSAARTLRGSNWSRITPVAMPPMTTGAVWTAASQPTSVAVPPRSMSSQRSATNDIPSPSADTVAPPQSRAKSRCRSSARYRFTREVWGRHRSARDRFSRRRRRRQQRPCGDSDGDDDLAAGKAVVDVAEGVDELGERVVVGADWTAAAFSPQPGQPPRDAAGSPTPKTPGGRLGATGIAREGMSRHKRIASDGRAADVPGPR